MFLGSFTTTGRLYIAALVWSSCVLMAQMGCVADAARFQEEPGTSELGKLISLAASSDRDDWLPAARELGRIATSDPALRDRVWEEARVNTLGMKFIRIEPGEFVMGPPRQHPLWPNRAHQVRLTRPLYICITETTNAHFATLYPNHQPNARFSPHRDGPVVGLNWDEIQTFCEDLSEREEASYRLPTEAEWEYVCRAGMPSPHLFCFGDSVERLSEYAWYGGRRNAAAPVALLKPNAWGVYDMHGNVLEVVGDWFARDYGAGDKAVLIDPKGPPSSMNHTLRGGEWYLKDVRGCECGFRLPWPLFAFRIDPNTPQFKDTIGFRIVRDVE